MPKWLAAGVGKPEPGALSSTGSTNAPFLQWRVHAGPGLDRKSGQARARLSLRAHVSGSCSLLRNVTATYPVWATLRRLSGWSSTPDCVTGATEPEAGSMVVQEWKGCLWRSARMQESKSMYLYNSCRLSLLPWKPVKHISCLWAAVMWLGNA